MSGGGPKNRAFSSLLRPTLALLLAVGPLGMTSPIERPFIGYKYPFLGLIWVPFTQSLPPHVLARQNYDVNPTVVQKARASKVLTPKIPCEAIGLISRFSNNGADKPLAARCLPRRKPSPRLSRMTRSNPRPRPCAADLRASEKSTASCGSKTQSKTRRY